jgi:acetylglutamate kinase
MTQRRKQGRPASANAPSIDPALLAKTQVLSEALPYMRKHAGKTFVIKYGGHAMGDDALAASFASDAVLLKQVGINPIIVHGGGPQIGRMLDRLRIKSSFIDGLRVTDHASVEIVEMVLSGSINKQIVSAINRAGGRAIGLSGKDGGLIEARKLRRTRKDPDSNIENILDLGFVGEPVRVDPRLLDVFEGSDLIPVIAPIGAGADGETYNINADTVAGAVAAAVAASRLYLLTDVVGVLDRDGALIADLDVAAVRAAIADGTIQGGMIPKCETCVAAVENGVEAAVIVDGRVPHALLVEIFTEHGVGTLIAAAAS